jgi:acetyl-CoA carboxylase alpha subunit
MAYGNIKQAILDSLDQLCGMDAENRIAKRIDKFSRMGVVVE